jgi:hypothetical protein
MNLITRVAGLLTMVGTLGFATTWSGVLVNAKCYADMQGNTRGSLYYVDRDTSWIVRYCAPSPKTNSFEFVLPLNGSAFPLDSQGNAQASAIMRKIGKKRLPVVQVVGVKSGQQVKVRAVRLMRVLRKNV